MRTLRYILLLGASCAFGQSSLQSGSAGVPNPNIAAFPAPPSGAVIVPNLQAQPSSNWVSLGGSAPSGGSNTGSVGVTFNNASPSLTGNAINLQANGNGYNVQTFNPQGCAIFAGALCTSFSHVTLDGYIYIPSSSTPLQGLEGPNVSIYTGSYLLYPSMQCGTNAGSSTPAVPTWNLWDSNNWISLNISCAAFLTRTDVWQHIQVRYDVNFAATPPTYTYNTMHVQNTPIYTTLARTYAASAFSGGANVKPQFQVDSQNVSTLARFYFDQFTAAFF